MADASGIGDIKGLVGLHRWDKPVMQKRQAIIAHPRALVVDAHARRQQPGARPVNGLMKKGDIPRKDVEVRRYRHFLVRNAQIADIGGDMGIGVVQDQGLDPVSLKGDRGVHMIAPEEGENASGRLPASLRVRFPHQDLQGTGPAVLLLLQGKDGAFGIVLIHPHIVQQILDRCRSIQHEPIASVAQLEAVHHKQTLVGGLIVIGYRKVFSLAVQAVGKAPFAR